MRTANKILYLLALIALLCAPLTVALATGPVILEYYDPDAERKAAVMFQNFNNTGISYEVYLGFPDFPSGSEFIDSRNLWELTTPNKVTFSYDPDSGYIRVWVNGVMREFYTDDLGKLNYIQVYLKHYGRNTSVQFNNVILNDDPIGDFTVAYSNDKNWMVSSIDLSGGFILKGDILLSGTQHSKDINMIEVTAGYSSPP